MTRPAKTNGQTAFQLSLGLPWSIHRFRLSWSKTRSEGYIGFLLPILPALVVPLVDISAIGVMSGLNGRLYRYVFRRWNCKKYLKSRGSVVPPETWSSFDGRFLAGFTL
jgi:hypothetical protein